MPQIQTGLGLGLGTQGAKLNLLLKLLKDDNTVVYFDPKNMAKMVQSDGIATAISDVLNSGITLEGSCQYTNNKTLKFNGLNERLTGVFTLVQPDFICLILRQNSWTTNDILIDGGFDASNMIQSGDVEPGIKAYSQVFSDQSFDLRVGIWSVIKIYFSPINGKFQIDENPKIDVNFGAADPNGFTIGGPPAINAYFADVEASDIIIRKNTVNEDLIFSELKKKRQKLNAQDFSSIAIIGNSFTKHPITAWWWGNWGMAASTRENDYAHVLESKIKQLNPAAVVTSRFSADWEQNHATFDYTSFDELLSTNPKCVLLRIGENVYDMTGLETSFQNLIDYIKFRLPSARIVVTGQIWTNEPKDIIIQSIAATNKLTYIPLSDLDVPENKTTVDAMVFGDDGVWHSISEAGDIAPGVANHFGDTGMRNLANRIYDGIF